MMIVRNLLVSLLLLLLPSCGLIKSVLKIPVSVLKTAGRTVGVSNLTDAPAEPVTDRQEKKDLPGAGTDTAPAAAPQE